MNNSKIYIFLIAFLFGLVFSQTVMAKPLSTGNISPEKTEITCKQALENVSRIKVGMQEAEILDLLGTPGEVKENVWSYNFLPCSPPPKIGEQITVGVGITFSEKAVKEIGLATICATGVIVSPPKKTKRKH